MKIINKLIVVIIAIGLLAGCASNPQMAQGCSHPNYGAAIVGGVAGGLLGSTIGRGVGKEAAEVVGAGTGAVVGSQVDCN